MVSSVTNSSLNGVFMDASKLLLDSGKVNSSRNGDVTFLNNVVLELTNPLSRHLHLDGRANNIFSVIAELFWVMSGSDLIDPFLSFYLPRAKLYSDDGETWRGGYGPRIYAHDQLENAIQMFKKDGLHTRRSVIDIYQSDIDSGVETNDLPCNNMIHFYVSDDKLDMNVFSRSADLVWGVTNVNIPEWTFMQEYVAQRVGVPAGSYSHWCTNLHVYDFTASQVFKAVDSNDVVQPTLDTKPCVFPEGDAEVCRDFFRDLVEFYEDIITERSGEKLCEIFGDYDVPFINNQLWDYAMILARYTQNKVDVSEVPFNNTGLSPNFLTAILASKSRNFDIY
jgi:thymidylate synthase